MSSSQAKTAPYGSWKSPITSDLIVAQSISLSDVRLDGGNIYWLEGRPQEQGRSVVVRAEAGAAPTDMIPAPFNARTRVHEYGGGSWTVRDGAVTFSNFADGRLYRLAPDASVPQPLTPEPPARDRQWRFADGVIDHRRNRWIGVREDHTAGGEPVNTIVAVDLGGGATPGASSRAATISMRRRGCRRTATGSRGWRGIIPTCRGTAPCSTSRRSGPMARRAIRN